MRNIAVNVLSLSQLKTTRGLRGQVIKVTGFESLVIDLWRFELHPERWIPYVSKPSGRSKFLPRRVFMNAVCVGRR